MTAVSPEDIYAASTEIRALSAYDVYVDTLKKLIALTEEAWGAKVASGHIDATNLISIWENHAVGVGGPRQSGKSTAIAQLSTSHDMIVMYNLGERDEMLRRLKEFHGDNHAFVVTANSLRKLVERRASSRQGPLPFPFLSPQRIYVDDSRWVFGSPLSLDLREFSRFVLSEFRAKPPTVICVG